MIEPFISAIPDELKFMADTASTANLDVALLLILFPFKLRLFSLASTVIFPPELIEIPSEASMLSFPELLRSIHEEDALI